MPRLLIHDGLSFDAEIVPGNGENTMPAIRIKYRPPTGVALLRYEEATMAPGDKRIELMIKLIADHLISWDVETHDGRVAEINESTLASLPAEYLLMIEAKLRTAGIEFAKTVAKN